MTDASDVQRLLPPEAFADSSGIGTPDDRDLEIERLRNGALRIRRIAERLLGTLRDHRDAKARPVNQCDACAALIAQAIETLRGQP